METIVIDITVKYNNKAGSGLGKTKAELDGLENSSKKTTKGFDKLSESMKKTEALARNLSNQKFNMRLDAVDKATDIITKTSRSVLGLSGKTFKFAVTAVDYATKPLRGILNFATSLKGIVMGIFAGKAAQSIFSVPTGIADSYTSALVGFETLFKSQERAQEMMNSLDKFAIETPFTTSNVITNSQKMLAMGWNADDIIRDMKTIGDAAAATGKGDDGFNSIVLALSQIKTKGKLSTEELNQLAEAGIRAKGYLAEGLGFGSDDAGMAKLSASLEKGLIGSEQALDVLLKGMEEYDGMMDKTANLTVKGLKSQLADTFETSILRKWGQGLQDGALKGLSSMLDFIDQNKDGLNRLGDAAKEMASSLSNWAADSLKGTLDKILKITNTDLFKNATLGGKVKILWDEMIGNPFNEWWNTKAPELAGKIGEGLGKGLKGAILGILGAGDSDIASGAIGIGQSFAESFISGFKPEKVGAAIWDAIKSVFATSHLNIFSDEDKNMVSTLISGGMLLKFISVMGPLIKGGTGIVRGIGNFIAKPVGAAVVGSELGKPIISQATVGSTVAGLMPSALGTSGVALGFAGVVSGMNDAVAGFEKISRKSQDISFTTAATKTSMVALGGILGGAIGSVIPGLGTALGAAIGAGIGGAGALTKGNDLGRYISDLADGTQAIRDAGEKMNKSRDEFLSALEKSNNTDAIIDEYEHLNGLLKDGNLPVEEREATQLRINGLVKDLASLYPDLISQYDVENGKLTANLDLLKQMSATDRERAKWQLESDVATAKQTFTEKDIGGKIRESNDTIEKLQDDAWLYSGNQVEKANLSYHGYVEKIEAVQQKLDEAYEKGNHQDYNDAAAEQQKLLDEINDWANPYNQRYDTTTAFKDNFDDVYRKDAAEKNAAVNEEIARNQEYMGSLKSLYDEQKMLVEQNNGIDDSIEDRVANLDNLDEAQQKSLVSALEQMQAAEEAFGDYELLPDEWKINIDIPELQEKIQNMNLLREAYDNLPEEKKAEITLSDMTDKISQFDELNAAFDLLPEEKRLSLSLPDLLDKIDEINRFKEQYENLPADKTMNLSFPELLEKISEFDRLNEAFGLLPEEQRVGITLEGLIEAIGGIENYDALLAQLSEEETTEISAPGAEEAAQDANDVTEAVESIPILKDSQVTVTGTDTAKSNVDSYLKSLESIPTLKTTTIRTVQENIVTRKEMGITSDFAPKANGGIHFSPIRALVGEAGPEAIVPLSNSKRKDGLSIWEQAGRALGMLDEQVTPHANGGILASPHVGLVAEDGPEAIIPLSSVRRQRGIELWERAGTLLGAFNGSKERPIPHADGGIFGDTKSTPAPYIQSNSGVVPAGDAPIVINVGGLQFSFGSDLRDSDSIVAAIRQQMPTVANELCQMIAKLLGKTYSNMALGT